VRKKGKIVSGLEKKNTGLSRNLAHWAHIRLNAHIPSGMVNVSNASRRCQSKIFIVITGLANRVPTPPPKPSTIGSAIAKIATTSSCMVVVDIAAVVSLAAKKLTYGFYKKREKKR